MKLKMLLSKLIGHRNKAGGNGGIQRVRGLVSNSDLGQEGNWHCQYGILILFLS